VVMSPYPMSSAKKDRIASSTTVLVRSKAQPDRNSSNGRYKRYAKILGVCTRHDLTLPLARKRRLVYPSLSLDLMGDRDISG